MNKTLLRALGVSVAAIALAMFVFGASAEEKKTTTKVEAKKPAACKTLKDEAACKARDDCMWVAAVMDDKTKKEKQKASCKAKPKPKPSEKK